MWIRYSHRPYVFWCKRRKEAYGEARSPLKIAHLMMLFEFCQKAYFIFARKSYEQMKRSLMGSPISGLIAELVLHDLENTGFTQHEPVFWHRYADDTFVMIKTILRNFYNLPNGIFPYIKFTSEEKQQQQLPFPDASVIRTLNYEIDTTIYTEPTNLIQLLSFHSTIRLLINEAVSEGSLNGFRFTVTKLKEHAGRAYMKIRRLYNKAPIWQVAAHTYETSHEFNFAAIKIFTQHRKRDEWRTD
ncbi:unnamed protein product [Dibothriocephalus latus]|uniref:Reverse transcriptase domain-containing protein n=1 Tax=Dibothriocephalus latus TaxID=60516 RepID=A0A3P7LHS6_DIBLA|nr:unnamed protein product [Dibothriocephalus latus]